MKDSKNNLKFNYLYRDAGNYKEWGSVVFSNPKQIDIKQIENQIKEKLIETDFFIAKDWGIPSLCFAEWDDDMDHIFHEFDSIELTSENPDDKFNRSISIFIKSI
jgi:hypothetical protein